MVHLPLVAERQRARYRPGGAGAHREHEGVVVQESEGLEPHAVIVGSDRLQAIQAEGRADIGGDRLQVIRARRGLVEGLRGRGRLVREHRGGRDQGHAHPLGRERAQGEHRLHRAEPAARDQHVRGIRW